MKILTSITVLSLIGLALAAPTSYDDGEETLLITKDIYLKNLVKYTGEHDIVNLLLPINSLNFDGDDSSESESNSKENENELTIFFVEADVDDDGKRIDRGLYVLKENKTTLLLENGRDAAASGDSSTLVFFGAKDGIYVYNKEKNTAEKYGTVDDSIISIAKEKTGDIIYILTENNEVYKVSENGNKKEKIDDIVNAKEIVLDYSNNLFYSDGKQAYVRTAEGVKKIEGLPENPNSIKLIKPPFILDDGIPISVDNDAYIIFSNGTKDESGFKFEADAKPTAYAPEGALIQYYAYDKKIYEYNILTLIFSELLLDEVKNYLNDKKDDIRSLAKISNIERYSA